MPLPTQDQVMGQLRLLIPAVGMIVSAVGIAAPDKVSVVVSQLMICVGPLVLIGTSIWSLFANSRASIMASAAKPAAPGMPAPQIVLPAAEAELAQTLPANVNTTNDVKVVTK